MMILETVNTHKLAVGDLLLCHGALVRLRERHVSTTHYDQGYGPCVWFATDVIDPGNTIPRHWLTGPNGWVVQGNALATWARVIG